MKQDSANLDKALDVVDKITDEKTKKEILIYFSSIVPIGSIDKVIKLVNMISNDAYRRDTLLGISVAITNPSCSDSIDKAIEIANSTICEYLREETLKKMCEAMTKSCVSVKAYMDKVIKIADMMFFESDRREILQNLAEQLSNYDYSDDRRKVLNMISGRKK